MTPEPQLSRSAILILADGARADVFEQMLAAGELPAISEHVVARGGYRRASSTFTSTTIPAHLPFLTGNFAGTADVPGYRWFERAKWRRGLPLGPWCLRSYNGPESLLVNRDISPAAPTLFELAPGSVNVFGAITRGLATGANLAQKRKNRLWLRAHYRGDYISADDAARETLVATLASESDHNAAPVRFVVLPGIDWNSHYDDPFGAGAIAAYRRVDETVAAAAAALLARGAEHYEQTMIAVVSDHGHCPVDQHFDLAVRIEREHNLRVAYHSLRAWRPRANVVSCVSGNAMAHLYLRSPGRRGWHQSPDRDQIELVAPGLIHRLIDEPAIDLLATIDRETGMIDVQSRRGRAALREDLQRGTLSYRVRGGADPFGYRELPEELDLEQALELTFYSEHPDGLTQLAQIFRSSRSGDIVVSASPGHDLRERFERPEHKSSHGALHAQHMHVPLAISSPIEPGAVRTSDVFGSVCDWIGLDAAIPADGRSRLLGGDRTGVVSATLAEPPR